MYGSHLSTITDCGLSGNGAKRSITTFLGGGGKCLPEIVTNQRLLNKLLEKIYLKK